MICRICSAAEAREIGVVEYYTGFPCSIYDCPECGCRFSKHGGAIHDWLHEHASSSYGLYRELADKCKRLFGQEDLSALKHELCLTSKYEFIIGALDRYPKRSRVLEVGCSRGHLTSYFIRAGYDILGSDVAPEAVAGARAAFGDFFATADSPAIRARAPYDAIYHVGTIGCVADPKTLTHDLLQMLKPGGKLLFNAPNAESCWFKGQLWIDAAPPPDVVTLFPPGFWKRQFSNEAEVTEEIEACTPERAFTIGLRKCFGRPWRKPTPLALEESLNDFKGERSECNGFADGLWSRLERGAVKAARACRLLSLAPSRPNPFGLFVTMTKKQASPADTDCYVI